MYCEPIRFTKYPQITLRRGGFLWTRSASTLTITGLRKQMSTCNNCTTFIIDVEILMVIIRALNLLLFYLDRTWRSFSVIRCKMHRCEAQTITSPGWFWFSSQILPNVEYRPSADFHPNFPYPSAIWSRLAYWRSIVTVVLCPSVLRFW